MRRIAVLMSRWAVHPATLGALYLLVLVAYAARRGERADGALAGQSRAIDSVVHTQFRDEVRRMTLAIVGATVALGTLLGMASGLLLDLRAWLLGDNSGEQPSAWRRRLAGLALVVVAHALFEAYAMAATPQLFAGAFYAQGGALRTVQVVVTDVLGPGPGVAALGAAGLVVLLAGPSRGWPLWRARFARVRREVLRARTVSAAATVAAAGLGAPSLTLGGRGPGISRAAAATSGEAPSARPNVLILAADSLRADRIDPRIAPRLSALADRGVRFDRGYVSLPRTFPSWVTLLTGRHPHHHGIRSMFPRWEDRAKDFDALPRSGSARLATTPPWSATSRGTSWTASASAGQSDARPHVRLPAADTAARAGATDASPALCSSRGRGARVFPVLRELNDAADPALLTRRRRVQPPSARRAAGRSS